MGTTGNHGSRGSNVVQRSSSPGHQTAISSGYDDDDDDDHDDGDDDDVHDRGHDEQSTCRIATGLARSGWP